MENAEWIHPNTITGPAAEGNKYFKRDYINKEFWREITKGNHILFTAPRRVGKTSVMKDLVANPINDYLCTYKDVESVTNSEEFYKTFYSLVVKCLGLFHQSKMLLTKWFNSRGIEEISADGVVKFKEKTIDYKHELLLLIAKLPELNQKVVLFLDEFPDVISAIRKKEGDDPAIEVLHTIREIRHNKKFDHITFVLAGSIGLEHVVESLDRLKLINDLHPIKIGPLNQFEARQLIAQLIDGASMRIEESIMVDLLTKLELFIPYFIQLMIEYCNDILYYENRIDVNSHDIELAFDRIVSDNHYLSDWESRLKPPYLSKEENAFCISLLTLIAHKSVISIQEMFNLAQKAKMKNTYMNLIKMLIRDGYVLETPDKKYRFSSPLLQSWWKNQHPIL